MKKINVALVRLIQFAIFVFFTFLVISYSAFMVMIPLAVINVISDVLGLIGINTLIGAFLGAPAAAYLCKVVYDTPALSAIIVDTGVEFVKAGKAKVDAFNKVAESIK